MPREEFQTHKKPQSVTSSIFITKAFFNRCVFNKESTVDGRESLGAFAQHWDDKHKVFTGVPAKGWFRHGADAFMYIALGYEEEYGVQLVQDDSNTFMGAMRRKNTTGGRVII